MTGPGKHQKSLRNTVKGKKVSPHQIDGGSWRHPVMIPGPGAWTLFSGFSLTTGTHQFPRHTRPSAPCSLSPTAIALLIHFSSPADSSPGPCHCLFWSERSCSLSQCHSSSDFSIYPSRLQSCVTSMQTPLNSLTLGFFINMY